MFYDGFKALCKQKGVSCKRAAEEIGLSNSITTKWKKTGATPKGKTLQMIADYFGVSTDYLLGQKNETTPALTEKDERGVATDEQIIRAFWGDIENERGKKRLEDVRRYAAFIDERDEET